MIMTYIAWLIMFASWCVAYRTIKSLQKELNRYKPHQELDELKAAAELTGRELSKWVALARNFGCFNQSELYMMVESMKNQVDFLCKSRKPADPQYVDEWFRFKKMF